MRDTVFCPGSALSGGPLVHETLLLLKDILPLHPAGCRVLEVAVILLDLVLASELAPTITQVRENFMKQDQYLEVVVMEDNSQNLDIQVEKKHADQVLDVHDPVFWKSFFWYTCLGERARHAIPTRP